MAVLSEIRVPRPALRIVPRGLLRIELRRNAMIWMLPVAVALFWWQTYRHVMALPPMWSLRAMTMQNDALLDFAMPVAGAAAWMGWRERRRSMTELLTSTARVRWARNLATWAATTCWALGCYLACVAGVYGITARQATWGGPLWWPVIVGAAGIVALSAFGFTAGALLPGRFTTPLVTMLAFFGLGFSSSAASGDHSYLLISPLIAGSVDVGADPGVATFYRYLPDLSIAQVMFLAGITIALLGLLGVVTGPVSSRGRRLRACAAVLTACGLAASGTAIALAGTAHLDAHGMTVIPALHDSANDQPVPYTPVCGGAVPVCLQSAYSAYLPAAIRVLEPALAAVAGLPGAPARLSQVAEVYQQLSGNGIHTGGGRGSAGEFVLPPVPGWEGATSADFASQLKLNAAVPLVSGVLGIPAHGAGSPAQEAVLSGLTRIAAVQGVGAAEGRIRQSLLPQPGSPAALAARRFAALSAAAQHAWLLQHLSALRGGQVTLAQLPLEPGEDRA
jgi:hypothetical protein